MLKSVLESTITGWYELPCQRAKEHINSKSKFTLLATEGHHHEAAKVCLYAEFQLVVERFTWWCVRHMLVPAR
jgi:hypothetical protein